MNTDPYFSEELEQCYKRIDGLHLEIEKLAYQELDEETKLIRGSGLRGLLVLLYYNAEEKALLYIPSEDGKNIMTRYATNYRDLSRSKINYINKYCDRIAKNQLPEPDAESYAESYERLKTQLGVGNASNSSITFILNENARGRSILLEFIEGRYNIHIFIIFTLILLGLIIWR